MTEAFMRGLLPDDGLDPVEQGLVTVGELAQDAARMLRQLEVSRRG